MSAAIIAQSVSKVFPHYRNRPVTLKESLVRRLTGRAEQASSFQALRDVTFSIERGRSLGIIGHNGAGKSTLLRLICGLGRPTRGHILHAGQVSGLLELGSGFHPDLTGRENIMTGGLLSGLTAREVRAAEPAIVEFSELEDFIDMPLRTYSSGMYVRLAFATALQFNPEILVIDEVLAVGDARFQQKCLARMERFRADGKTLILTSHVLDQVRSLCDEVLVLEDGRAVLQGDPDLAIDCYNDLMRQRSERRSAQLGGARRAAAAPMPAQGSRQGTQEAAITEVRLADLAGRPIEGLPSGQGLRIELDYLQADPQPDLIASLAIYNDAHVKCFEAIVPSLRAAFGPPEQHGTVCCELPALPLQAGRYFVNVGLFPSSWSHIYDYHWGMHSFYVYSEQAGDPAQRSGIVALDPNWSLVS